MKKKQVPVVETYKGILFKDYHCNDLILFMEKIVENRME